MFNRGILSPLDILNDVNDLSSSSTLTRGSERVTAAHRIVQSPSWIRSLFDLIGSIIMGLKQVRPSARSPRVFPFFVTAVIVLVAVVACGGGASEPRPTPLPPEIRNATSTASAIERELQKAPCVVSPYTRTLLREVADELWSIGSNLTGREQGSLGLQFFEASIAYGILDECRETAGTPVAEGSPMASPAPGDPICLDRERTIDRLRDAAAKGTVIAFTAAFRGIEIESLPTMLALNDLLIDLANELEIACGFRLPATPGASPQPGDS
jgi:hypothetical protein